VKMAPPNRNAIGRVAFMTFGLLGGGAVGFWMQTKMMDEERAARAIRMKSRLDRLKEMEVAAGTSSSAHK